MTNCYDTNWFVGSGAGFTTRPWAQYRQVATRTVPTQTRTFPVTGGGPGDMTLQNMILSWSNFTPIRQIVYGMVTRGGLRITLTARSRGYLITKHGVSFGGAIATLQEESRVGIGAITGSTGIFANNSYAVVELRQNAITMPLQPSKSDMPILNPGETINVVIELHFVAEFWQTAAIAGGTSATESSLTCGDTRLDLFAIPTP